MVDDAMVVPLDDIKVDEHQNYIERPIEIPDQKIKALHNKVILVVKVYWEHYKGSKWTWEPKSEMREHYSQLFTSTDFDEV